uniref:Predicted protein n=1 Tax=Hordeum vulgare subsp. vulgare TaxID=112509 RepID=F2EL39_HORVV|nr:predicted protein [Hordeum vulgare subsp. vulgare]
MVGTAPTLPLSRTRLLGQPPPRAAAGAACASGIGAGAGDRIQPAKEEHTTLGEALRRSGSSSSSSSSPSLSPSVPRESPSTTTPPFLRRRRRRRSLTHTPVPVPAPSPVPIPAAPDQQGAGAGTTKQALDQQDHGCSGGRLPAAVHYGWIFAPLSVGPMKRNTKLQRQQPQRNQYGGVVFLYVQCD